MNKTEKFVIGFLLLIAIVATCNHFYQKKNRGRNVLDDKAKPSVWIQYWKPKEGVAGGHCYNDLIRLNDNQYLFVGKDNKGNTFDSSIITINQ